MPSSCTAPRMHLSQLSFFGILVAVAVEVRRPSSCTPSSTSFSCTAFSCACTSRSCVSSASCAPLALVVLRHLGRCVHLSQLSFFGILVSVCTSRSCRSSASGRCSTSRSCRSSASWSLWLLWSAGPFHVRLRVRLFHVRAPVAVVASRHLGFSNCWCPQVSQIFVFFLLIFDILVVMVVVASFLYGAVMVYIVACWLQCLLMTHWWQPSRPPRLVGVSSLFSWRLHAGGGGHSSGSVLSLLWRWRSCCSLAPHRVRASIAFGVSRHLGLCEC